MSFVDLNDAVIAQVRQTADIVEVISQATPLKNTGRSFKGLCPFHREKTPSFTVDRGKGLFYCFGCGAGGDVFKFLMLSERFTFPEAVEHLASRYGITLPRRKSSGEKSSEKEVLLSIADEAGEAFHQALQWKPNPAEEYLRKRGIAEEIWRRYGFGYAPDSWDYLLSRLGRKYPTEKLEQAGLVLPRKSGSGYYDRFRNRLMIPIHSEGGNVIGFGGRSLDGSDPKYLNSPESPLFNKSNLLFNLHRAKDAIRRLDRAILVEGYFDCISLEAAGVQGVVASMGTSLTPGQASLLGRFTKRVIVGYDGDPAGQNATLRAAPILLAAGHSVEALDLGEGHDPDTYIREHGLEGFMELLGRSKEIVDFAIERWGADPASLSAREKSEKLEMFLPLLQAMSGVAKNHSAQRVADGFRLEFETVWSLVRGRSSETVRVVMPSGGAPVSTSEKELLRAILQGRLPAELEREVREDYFEDPACRTIYSVIKQLEGKGEGVDFSELATHLKGEFEVSRLSELALSDDTNELDRSSLEKILRHMERRHIDRRLKQIQLDIQDADRAGDQGRLTLLLSEKTELSRQLHTLK